MLTIERFLERARRSDDSGMSLVAVVSIMAIGFIVVSVAFTASLFAIQTNQSAKISQQAIAAAESGRDYAAVQLTNDPEWCPSGSSASAVVPIAGVPASSSPSYTITLFQSAATTAPATMSGASLGCPTPTTNWVVVQSIGRDASGKTTTIQTTYEWKHVFVTLPGGGVGYNNASYTTYYSSYNGDLVIRNGDFTCGSTTITGSVYVLNGNAKFADTSGTCKITGRLVVSGNVTGAGSGGASGSVTIGGDVIAGGGVTWKVHAQRVALGFGYDSTVQVAGQIYARGTVALSEVVDGCSFLCGSQTARGIAANVRAYGNGGSAVQGWEIGAGGMRTRGNINPNSPQSGSAQKDTTVTDIPSFNPSIPTFDQAVADMKLRATWQDVGLYSDWSSFATKRTITDCSWLYWRTTVRGWIGSSSDHTKLLIDATACGSVDFDFTLFPFTVSRDVVILVNGGSFTLATLTVSGPDQPHDLFFVQVDPSQTPDAAGNPVADCNGRDPIEVGMSSSPSNLHLMIYSPCGIDRPLNLFGLPIGLSSFTGQVYAHDDTADAEFLNRMTCTPMKIDHVIDLPCTAYGPSETGSHLGASEVLGDLQTQTEP